MDWWSPVHARFLVSPPLIGEKLSCFSTLLLLRQRFPSLVFFAEVSAFFPGYDWRKQLGS
jgi:hypothetical protein